MSTRTDQSLPTLPTASITIPRERAVAICASAENLESFVTEQMRVAPKAHLRVRGTHTVSRDATREEVVDFDLWMDCAKPVGRGTMQIQNNAESECIESRAQEDRREGQAAQRVGSASPTADDAFERRPLRGWCEDFITKPSDAKRLIIRKEVAHFDEPKISARIQNYARMVIYGGSVSVTLHVSGSYMDLSLFDSTSTEVKPSDEKPSCSVITGSWKYRWPFDNHAVYVQDPKEKEWYSSWMRRLQEAMVDEEQGWLREDDPPRGMGGKSPKRRAMMSKNLSRPTPEILPGGIKTEPYQRWGCDE